MKAFFSRLVVCSFLLFPLTSCVGTFVDSSPSTLEVEVRSGTASAIDKETEERSRALHAYLVGELEASFDRVPDAIEALETGAEFASGVEEARVRARLAELYVRVGDLEESLDSIDRAIELDPSELSYLLLKADVLETLERFYEAEPLYLSLMTNEDYWEQVRLLLTNLYLRAGRAEKAIGILQASIRERSDFLPAYFLLSQIYEQSGSRDKASEFLNEALDIDPYNERALTELIGLELRKSPPDLKRVKQISSRLVSVNGNSVLGRRVLSELAIEARDFGEALEHLHVLETVQDDPSEIRLKIALVSIEQGKLTDAERQLSLIIASDPSHSRARYYLASILAEKEQSQQAIDLLQEVEDDSSVYVRARMLLALLLRKESRLAEAIDLLKELVEKSNYESRFVLSLVAFYQESQEFEEAKSLLESFLEREPSNLAGLFRLGTTLHALGEIDESEKVMERVLEVAPRHSDAMNYLAYSLAERGEDLERAEGLIRTAISIDQDDGYYLDTLGWILFKRGKYQEARKSLARAFQIVSDDLVILHHLIEVLARLEEFEEAEKLVDQFESKAAARGELSKDEKNSLEAVRALSRKIP